MNQYINLRKGDHFYLRNVKYTLSEIDGRKIELYAPDTRHHYEVGTEKPRQLNEFEEVYVQLTGPARTWEAELIIDTPKEIPLTSHGVDGGPPFWPRESLTSVEKLRRAETIDLAS